MFEYIIHPTGIEVVDSYKVFWDKETINAVYVKDGSGTPYFQLKESCHRWDRSKFSLYFEWFIHTLCYKLGIKKERAKNVFLEFDKSWFKNLFK